MSELVSIAFRDDVALILLKNPPVNAIGQGVRDGLLAALDQAAASGAKAIVLAGDGRGFSGGADISEFSGKLGGPDLNEIVERCERNAKPTVAAIHGMTLGAGWSWPSAALIASRRRTRSSAFRRSSSASSPAPAVPSACRG
jgi:3-hydroxyacyl-CoA dehydrogenase